MNTDRSKALYDQARLRIPGGVNSPVRAFKSVGMTPVFIARAAGVHMWDVDGNRYIDYVGSWGPMILGHAHSRVLEAIGRAASKGTSFGAPTEVEVDMAELIASLVPSIDVVRMVNSGTEATMSAIRLARAFTKRERVIKFEGCYHGHADAFLVKAGSGVMTLGIPDSPGVPQAVAAGTLTAGFNDLPSVRALFEENAGQVAAVIVEPVVGNMGCVPPEGGFLEGLRELCTEHRALLVFDEVMTGFRLAAGGAQERFGVMPDLTTLGKIIGGGLPVGAYGGRADIMAMVAPSGPMYQAGTLSGNPVAMAAGLETLKTLKEDGGFYQRLEATCAQLESDLRGVLKEVGGDERVTINRVGSMMTVFFSGSSVRDFASAMQCDTNRFGVFFRSMLEQGVYLPPSQFEAAFVSSAHGPGEIERTIEASRNAFRLALR